MSAPYDTRTALLVIDVQNDFAHPDGSLYVDDAAAAIRAVNDEVAAARAAGALVATTQDWHPADTPHFAKDGGTWPVHCVADTWGAGLHPDLDPGDHQVFKGVGGEDGYSGFSMVHPTTGATSSTGLDDLLRGRGIERVVVVGLATDYCVKATALDAVALGYGTTVVRDGVRPVELEPGDGQRALDAMADAGVALALTTPPGRPAAIPSALVTDLYELTMAAAYQAEGVDHPATFELFVRHLPATRRFLLAAGLDDALAGLESWRFDEGDIDYLAGLDLFPAAFLDRLDDLRFTGDVWALPEGEAVFAGEPLVRVTAPLVEAQLVETWLLNRIASQTMLASKAARVALACGERSFVDFSARRDHGVDAAMAAARAAWMCGASGSSLVAAGRRFGIPLSGTMAHSFVMSYDDERDAFRAYARTFPQSVVLLIDTYDTVTGAHRAAEVAHELAAEGIRIGAVRLDSGDLGALAHEVRAVLDAAALPDIGILASGDLDEHRIVALLADGAPVDAFGVGTQLGTSADAPTLGAVYKLVEDAAGPKMKLASGKVTLPGRKQVWRKDDHDVLSLDDEIVPGGRPLLVQVMAGGRRTEVESLDAIRARATATIAGLPGPLRDLTPPDGPVWPVEISPGLGGLAARVQAGLDGERAR